jgi:hypothetical protein
MTQDEINWLIACVLFTQMVLLFLVLTREK